MMEKQSSVSSALVWVHELLDLLGSQPSGQRGPRQCPAHADSSPSLAVAEGAGDRVLVHCHGGCTTQEVLAALRISERHLYQASSFTPAQHQRILGVAPDFPPLATAHGWGRGQRRLEGYHFEVAHDYGDFQLVRSRHPVTLEKSLVWERRDPAGAWIPGLGGAALADLPLYQERQVQMGAAAGDIVVVVESESSVDALMAQGIYATTWAGGASQPNLDRIARVLGGANLVVIPDNDEPGLRCARRIIEHLNDLGHPPGCGRSRRQFRGCPGPVEPAGAGGTLGAAPSRGRPNAGVTKREPTKRILASPP